jgi:valyl-tRNA synthetase
MLGDTAVAVHPDDDRYSDLIGQQLQLPLAGRTIPVVADDYVDPEFGTGCVKITPAHDFNDYEIGKRHDLPMINVLTDDARINSNAPSQFQGLDRFAARELVVQELEQQELLEKIEEHRLVIPRGDRSGAIVEPYLTDQWYVKIEPLAQPAIAAVEDGRIKFVPSNWANTYFEWMHNIQDWCISRQLWWGHRIPAWYDDEGNIYVGNDEADARARNSLAKDLQLHQDEDVLDTWFSSALWPFTTLGWPEQTARLQKFYPGNVLVTGFDIIFFWVARMIMMGLKFAGDVPFKHVYIHGLIRDNHGQKMSKSKGNVLDPIDLIEGIDLESLVTKRSEGLLQPQMAPAIERVTREDFPDGIPAFGTDALRFTFAALATTGRDIRFDLGRIEGYRNFCNKLWNAARYVLMQVGDQAVSTPEPRDLALIDRWIISRLSETVATVHNHLESYRFDLASQAMYEFVWNEFCDWYLELSKPALQAGPEHAQAATRHTLLRVLEETLRMLHPVMPFVTEEIWQRLKQPLGLEGDTIMLQAYPQSGATDEHAHQAIEWLKGVLLEIRRIRSEQNLPPGKQLPVLFHAGTIEDRAHFADLGELLGKLGRIEAFTWLEDEAEAGHCAVALLGELKIMIPLAGLIEVDAELGRLEKLLQKEQAELNRSEAKLGNPQFVNNAPDAVVDQERERLKNHTAKVDKLREQIARLEQLG